LVIPDALDPASVEVPEVEANGNAIATRTVRAPLAELVAVFGEAGNESRKSRGFKSSKAGVLE
jgi:hypothetical protein